MSTARTTGLLLMIGPVVTLVMWMGLWPALIGGGGTPAEALAELLANQQLSLILGTLGTLGMLSTFIGYRMLTGSLQGDENAGGSYAQIAGMLIVLLAAVTLASSGLQFGVMEVGSEGNFELAAILQSGSDNIGAMNGFFWGLATTLIGLALVMQKKVTPILAYLLVVIGVVGMIAFFDFVEIPDVVGMVMWVLWSAATVAVGFFTYKAAN